MHFIIHLMNVLFERSELLELSKWPSFLLLNSNYKAVKEKRTLRFNFRQKKKSLASFFLIFNKFLNRRFDNISIAFINQYAKYTHLLNFCCFEYYQRARIFYSKKVLIKILIIDDNYH